MVHYASSGAAVVELAELGGEVRVALRVRVTHGVEVLQRLRELIARSQQRARCALLEVEVEAATDMMTPILETSPGSC